MNNTLSRFFGALLVTGLLISAANAGTTTFGPSAYLSETPDLTGDTPDGYFCRECSGWIEDFEMGTVDPFLSIDSGEVLFPRTFSGLMNSVTDSVDGDDGVIDGFGNDGHSWFAPNSSVTVSFANPVKNAGLVFTDGDRISTNVRLEAFDIDGNSLAIINAGDLADDTFTGETAEDTFMGFQDMDASISSITLSLDAGIGIEIDHISWQEACAIPEPSSALISVLGLFALIGFRRRRA